MIELFARAIVRYRFVVIASWMVISILAVPWAARVGEVLSIESGWVRPVESSQVDSFIEQALPRAQAKIIAVVLRAPMAVDSVPFSSLVQGIARVVAEQPYVRDVISYLDGDELNLVSSDRHTTALIATIGSEHADTASRVIPGFRTAIRQLVETHPLAHEVEVAVTGEPALEWDVRTVSIVDARRGELRALAPTAAVLVLAFGALAAAAIPIVIGVLAIIGALAALYIVGAFTPIAVLVLPIVSMAGLGVGIDYSLFIVSRFREELGRGVGPAEASVRATMTAGRAVIISGLTVAIGFAALLLTPASETRSIAVGGLLVVAVAVALATTLLPASLAVIGNRVDWPRGLARHLARYHAAPFWEHWSKFLARHRRAALGSGLALVAVIAWPFSRIEIGVPPAGWFPPGTESSRGVEMMESMGGRGALLPIRVLLQAPQDERLVGVRYLRGLMRFSQALRADDRVSKVVGPVDLGSRMSTLHYVMLYGNMAAATRRHPELVGTYVTPDGDAVLMDVFLADTVTMMTAMSLVRDVRTTAYAGFPGLSSVTVRVGGIAAAGVDEEEAILAALPQMVLLVVVVTGVLLAGAFRSVLVPVKAVLLNLFSVAGALGLIVVVFQWGFGSALFGLDAPTEAVFVVVPILVFAVVFGLSMDYEVFLLSRIKEAYDDSGDNDRATIEGIQSTGSLITSAAAIMVVVFGTFAFSRVLVVQFLGFALAVAVFLDATLIRMVIVPAFMHVAGRWNWWPGDSR